MNPARLVILGMLLSGLVSLGAAPAAAHRNPCHTEHACPSDHHTYTYKSLWCTSYSDERLVTDKKTLRVGGRTYWCGVKKSGRRR
jgi:hypothetical protein